MAWQIEFRNGLWLPQVGWWLDAHSPQKRSFVSHAHADHTARHDEILCSAATARLMRARLPAQRIEHVLAFGQTEPLTEDCNVTLHAAGHVFGSSQILLHHAEHGRLLYTGDFKLQPGLAAEPCTAPPADVLVMETTFGRPHYEFPPAEKVFNDLVHFCHETLADGGIPVLFAYSLGKSQELLAGLAAAQLPVMLHAQTLKLTKIYEDFGFVFPAHREFSAESVAGHIVICPPQSRESPLLRSIPGARTAVVSGWALDPGAVYRYQCDAAFPLSDHADFPDLLRFVELVQPRRVFTLHGFAADFARTLRERGIEAWAIGEDNQLDMNLAARSAPRAAARALAPAAAAPADSTSAGDFSRFVAVAEAVKATPKKPEKIERLRAYLADLDTDSAGLAATFLTGRAFPPSDPRHLALDWALVKRAVLEVAGRNEADYRAAYQRLGDAGDAASAVLAEKTAPRPHALAEIGTFFDQVAAARGPTAKLDLLRPLLATLAPGEARYLVKIATGDQRIGLKEGLLEEAIAAATGQPLDAVRDANLLGGDLAAVVRAARAGRLDTIQLAVFHPLQFMLASFEPTAGAIVARFTGHAAADGATEDAPVPIWLEEKCAGLRCQLHKLGARVELYSRDLARITDQFPELVRAAQALPGDCILDGTLLAWGDGRALPFAELQKRLGRTDGDDFFLGAEIPVAVSCHDLLWIDGHPLLKEPLSTRRALLAKFLGPPAPPLASRFPLAPVRTAYTAEDVESALIAARAHGHEGLMAKDPASPYTPGRRGLAWLKLEKTGATLDVVVVAAEYGQRRDVLSDYTFAIRDEAGGNRLLTVGKAHAGLTDAEIARLAEHFLAHTLEVRGRQRIVVPDTVIEVTFDLVQPSSRHPSGFALRLPRIARLRPDKKPSEIDTLETCRRLAAAMAGLSAAPSSHPDGGGEIPV